MAFMTSASTTARTLRAVCISGALSLLALPADAMSQPTPQPTSQPVVPPPPTPGIAANSAGTTTNAAKLAAKPDVRPLWNELTPAQQQALAPLAQEWNKLDTNHKTKWLAVSNKYPAMSPEQQKRLQENIRAWARLTPEQHRIARESYARAKKLNLEQKTAQWQQYQQLPEEQKRKLAAAAASKKRIVNLPNPHNKTKTVEPLKSAKKPALAHKLAPQSAIPVIPAATPTAQPPVPVPPTSVLTAPPAQTTTPALPSTMPAENQ
ncbi:MAG: DUF3106 domain-containing protein [Burkholderiales bacterium]